MYVHTYDWLNIYNFFSIFFISNFFLKRNFSLNYISFSNILIMFSTKYILFFAMNELNEIKKIENCSIFDQIFFFFFICFRSHDRTNEIFFFRDNIINSIYRFLQIIMRRIQHFDNERVATEHDSSEFKLLTNDNKDPSKGNPKRCA